MRKIRQFHRSLRIDLAECPEMTYLCRMKRLILHSAVGVSAFFVLLLFSLASKAQTAFLGFSPDSANFMADSIGSTLTFGVDVGAAGVYGAINLYGSEGVTSNPNWVTTDRSGMGGSGLFVTAQLYKLGCIIDTLTAVSTFYDYASGGNYDSIAAFFMISGYVYDPQKMGQVQLDKDTFNFGNVPIGKMESMFLSVRIDTFESIFRELEPLNVQVPFSSADSISPEFDSCYNYSPSSDYFQFQPTQIGHYIDTTYLFDPIRKDSTLLILIGEGVAAGVAESRIVKPVMQVYPNPCDQFANIVLPSEGLEQVAIRNALGANVQSYRNVNSDLTVDASSLPGGIYFIEARTGDAVVMKKLVVIH